MIINSNVFHSVISEFFALSALSIFAISCLAYLAANYFQIEVTTSQDVLLRLYNEKLTQSQVKHLISRQEKWLWLSYVVAPISLLLNIFYVTVCLNVGAIFQEYKVSFLKLFRVVTIASIILAFGKIFRCISLMNAEVNDLTDIISSDIFSPLGYIDILSIPQWLWYPLSSINIFHLFFLLVLIFGVKSSFDHKNYRYIFISYGIGWLILNLFIIFIQLYFLNPLNN